MVLYQSRLANVLKQYARVSVITASNVPRQYFSPEVQHFSVDTGTKSGAASTLFHLPGGLLQFYRLVRTLDADIYHITSHQEWNLFTGFFLRSMGKRILYTVHDPSPHLGATAHSILLEKWFRPLAGNYMVLSRHSFNLLTAQGIASERIGLTHLSDLFLETVTPTVPCEKRILFYGRLERYKGLEDLLQAARKILPAFPGWKLHIIGSGNLSLEKDLISHPQIVLESVFVPDEKQADLFTRAEIVVLPYIEASQSGVVPMAMAFGRPVVATRVGSLPEYVKDGYTGLLVPPNNPEQLSEALARLMADDELRKNMGRNAYEVFQRDFNWDLSARHHLAVYQKMISSP